MIVLDQLVRRFGRDNVTVLLFHKVPLALDPLVPDDPNLDTFVRILDVVMSQFSIYPLGDMVDCLGKKTLPKNAACITFDDGYADWINGLVPVLSARKVHATFFVSTGQFTGSPMWHERVIHAVRHSHVPHLKLSESSEMTFFLRTIAEKQLAIRDIQQFLKYKPINERETIFTGIEAACGVTPLEVKRMPASDLRALHSQGFGVGTHTVNHPILTHASKEDAFEEIVTSKEQIEQMIGGKVEGFAYPNGHPGTDYSAQHVAMVKKAGYRYAVSTEHGVLRRDSSLFQIPRFTPWGPSGARMLAQVLRNQVRPTSNLPEA